MSLITIFFTAWIMGFSGAMMPGPMLTVNINESMRRGIKAGPLLVLGHAILELALVIGLIFGLSMVIKNSMVTAVIGIAGGGFLLWMGADMLKSVWKGTASLDLTATGDNQNMGPVLAGILTSLANPYWSLWWATIGLSYLTVSRKLGMVGVVAFFAGHILADFMWYGAVSFAVAKGRRFMSDRLYKGIIVVCGLFLVFLALSFLKHGLFGIIG